MRTAERTRRPLAFEDAKLAPPQIRDGTIRRPELVHRLRPTARSTVAVIVAAGGYGKTTLLAELAGQVGNRPFVWVTVDDTDNDPLTFVRCIIRGLERSGVMPLRAPRARTRPADSHAVLVAHLVRALKAARPLALVLDDVHLITSLRSRKVVETLANNLPAQSQLLLASRTNPRLGLTALRAQGRLMELGTEDLRLSAHEALQLLRAAGVDASSEEAEDLTERSEGWPAGLYLAALAYSDGQALTGFGGSDRFVSDYFDAEYLDDLDPDDLAFLTRASVLERLSGPVCDAVLQTSGSAAQLERVARGNLFITGLGSGKPHVYRLHPMLRDALGGALRRRDPADARAIAGRAADWSERHGDVEDAVGYAWAAGDRERFAMLVEQAILPLFQIGRLTTVESWLARLDPELLERHPALAVCGAFVHTVRGRPDDAESWAAIAERAPPGTAMPDGTPTLEPWTAALRAAMCRAGKDEMRQDAAAALSGLAEGSPWRPSALFLLGIGQLLAGETGAADEILAEAHLAAVTAGWPNTAAVSAAARSLLAAAEGRWDAAEDLAATARNVLEDAGLEDYPTSSITFVAGARTAVRQSDWVRARNDLAHVHAHLPSGAPGWFASMVSLEAARTHLGLSERNEAEAALALAEAILARSPDLGVLHDQAAELRDHLDRTVQQTGPQQQLTPAEQRLLPFLTTHLTFREIGDLLHISRNTVKTQAICTYRKLGVTSRSEAIDRAVELGLVDRPDALDVAGQR